MPIQKESTSPAGLGFIYPQSITVLTPLGISSMWELLTEQGEGLK